MCSLRSGMYAVWVCGSRYRSRLFSVDSNGKGDRFEFLRGSHGQHGKRSTLRQMLLTGSVESTPGSGGTCLQDVRKQADQARRIPKRTSSTSSVYGPSGPTFLQGMSTRDEAVCIRLHFPHATHDPCTRLQRLCQMTIAGRVHDRMASGKAGSLSAGYDTGPPVYRMHETARIWAP